MTFPRFESMREGFAFCCWCYFIIPSFIWRTNILDHALYPAVFWPSSKTLFQCTELFILADIQVLVLQGLQLNSWIEDDCMHFGTTINNQQRRLKCCLPRRTRKIVSFLLYSILCPLSRNEYFVFLLQLCLLCSSQNSVSLVLQFCYKLLFCSFPETESLPEIASLALGSCFSTYFL